MRISALSFSALAVAVGLSFAAPASAAGPANCPYTYLCVDTSTGAMQFGPGAYADDSRGAPNLAVGSGSSVSGLGTAVGANSSIDATSNGSAFGGGSLSNKAVGVAMGTSARLIGGSGVSIGAGAKVNITAVTAGNGFPIGGSVALGPAALTNGYSDIAIGDSAQAGLAGVDDSGNTAIGNHTYVVGTNNVGIGNGAKVFSSGSSIADNSVAIGAGTEVNESNVVGFGGRRLTQVANGITGGNAVNISQLGTAIGYLGGYAGIDSVTGVWTAPTYVLDNGVYHDVGSALTGLQQQIGNATSGSAPVWLATDAPNNAATTNGFDAVAVGPNATVGIAGSSWGGNTAVGANSSAGTLENADGSSGQATAFGQNATAAVQGSTALGQGAATTGGAISAVALGQFTTTDRAYTVAVGNRTLSQLADGVELQDGVTVSQLNRGMAAFGGGASFIGGVYTAPTFVLTAPGAQGTYRDTNSALLALDNGLNATNTRIDNLPPPGNGGPGVVGPQGPKGDTGAPGAPGQNGKDGVNGKDATGGTDALAVHYDGADKDKVTLSGTNGTTIANVQTGVADTDAANVGQVDAQVRQAITTANSYTDASSAQTLSWANAYTDRKFAELNKRFDSTQAMATAQTQMVATFAGADPANHNRIAAGVGFAGGHNGISAGYQHTSESGHTAWNIGGAVSGNDRTIGAGVGYSW